MTLPSLVNLPESVSQACEDVARFETLWIVNPKGSSFEDKSQDASGATRAGVPLPHPMLDLAPLTETADLVYDSPDFPFWPLNR